ncbi:MAG: cation:proton antiporter [Hyphomonadaceae bacterium]
MNVHGIDLTSWAIIIAAAIAMGLVLIQFRLPSMVAFIAAGVILGPTGFGLVSNIGAVNVLAEIGVLMLLFLAGMKMPVASFIKVLRPVSLAVGIQMAGAIGICFLMSLATGWDTRASLLFGFILAMSSTAVALNMLEELGETNTRVGQLTIGLMIAQDIAVVPMLIVVESFGAARPDIAGIVLRIAVALGALAAIIWVFRKGRVIDLPFFQQLRGRDDLVALFSLMACFAAASLSGLLDLSPAYGAFAIGLVAGNTSIGDEIKRVATPIQSVLVVMFFLSVGLLIDLTYVRENLWLVLGSALGAIVFKTALNIISLRLARVESSSAYQVGLATAQIGEFSFILAGAGLSVAALDSERYRLAIAVIAATLIMSPIWMVMARRVHDGAKASLQKVRDSLRTLRAARFAQPDQPDSKQDP